MRSKLTFRPARDEDVVAVCGGKPDRTIYAMAAEKGGATVGVGGVYFDRGHPVVFTDVAPELLADKRGVAVACRMMMAYLDALLMPVYATPDKNLKTSEPLLRKLGFEPTGEFYEGVEILVRKGVD
jgi:hypothetical protein